jgi:hypothetical protein
MKTIIGVLIWAAGAQSFAEENPFARCEPAIGQVTELNCRIGVVDEYISEYLGESALLRAQNLSQRCGYDMRRWADPEINLLNALECVLVTKIGFYEDGGN